MHSKLFYIKILKVLLIILKYNSVFCQINDNFQRNTLESGSYDILDYNDYQNLKLIITTSKKIYSGIPPQHLVTTTANLINVTSLISINSNYLLAACVQDYLLVKIKLSDGSSSPLINYNIFNDLYLNIPIKSCSLSILDDIVYIGYTRAHYYETEANKTNIVMKFTLTDLNSENGPSFVSEGEEGYFIFPEQNILTESSRQIGCEPLKIKNFNNNNGSDFRLVCLFEDYRLYNGVLKYQVYVIIINETFNGLENDMFESSLYRMNSNSGFRVYRLSDTESRCIMKKVGYDVFLKIDDSKITISKSKPNLLNDNAYSSNLDLFDYNENLIFSSETNNKVYYFNIRNGSSDIYFRLYDHKENLVKKIQD